MDGLKKEKRKCDRRQDDNAKFERIKNLQSNLVKRSDVTISTLEKSP